MNTEDIIKKLEINPPEMHKSVLRTRLINNIEITKKKRSLRWLYVGAVALPLAMVALLVSGAIWQPSDNTPKIVEQVTRPLTSKQVFAAAQQIATDQKNLQEGEWFYQKRIRSYGQTETCGVLTEIEETYWRSDNTTIHTRLNVKTGKLIERSVRTDNENGTYKNGKYDTFDQSALDPKALESQPVCDIVEWKDDADHQKFNAHLETVAKAYGFTGNEQKPAAAGGRLYLGDLRSGNPDRHAKTFVTLQDLNEWEVKQNEKKTDYKGGVISLSFDSGPNYKERIYFDQKTKQFIGLETFETPWGFDRWTVVESGVRSYTLE